MNVNAVDHFSECAATCCGRNRHPALTTEMLVDGCDDDVLDIICRNAGDRSDLGRLSFSMQAWQRDIIAITDAGLGRMRRRHAVACVVKQQSSQRVIARVPNSSLGGPLIRQLLLDCIKQGAVHDWWLLAGQDLTLI